MERRQYQTIVLGLGALGSATAWALARRTGGDVLGLEQSELSHVHAGSHDHSRPISLAHDDINSITLVRAAYRAWARLETERDLRLVHRVGELNFFPEGSLALFEAQRESLTQVGVSFEQMDGSAAMRRWTQFRLDDSVAVLHQPDGGLISTSAALGTLQRSARHHGARLIEHAVIHDLRVRDGAYDVITSAGHFTTGCLILAPGALTNALLRSFGLFLPLRVIQQQGVYFAAEHLSQFMPGRFPIWRWRDNPTFAGVPVHGAPGVRVGQEGVGPEVTNGLRPFEPDLGVQHRVSRFVQRLLPQLGPQLFCRPCLTTLTPDLSPIVDRVPGQANAWLAVDGAYGFEFAPALGEALADLALGLTPEFDMTSYRVDRVAVRELQPARRTSTP